jgi:hypothetical protein
MSDDITLADLQDAVLDRETVGQLFLDLSALAEILEIRVKRAPTRLVTDEAATLEDARAALESGEAMAVQIRYRHDRVVWLDTLMRLGKNTRLVRTRAPG